MSHALVEAAGPETLGIGGIQHHVVPWLPAEIRLALVARIRLRKVEQVEDAVRRCARNYIAAAVDRIRLSAVEIVEAEKAGPDAQYQRAGNEIECHLAEDGLLLVTAGNVAQESGPGDPRAGVEHVDAARRKWASAPGSPPEDRHTGSFARSESDSLPRKFPRSPASADRPAGSPETHGSGECFSRRCARWRSANNKWPWLPA